MTKFLIIDEYLFQIKMLYFCGLGFINKYISIEIVGVG